MIISSAKTLEVIQKLHKTKLLKINIMQPLLYTQGLQYVNIPKSSVT